MRSLIENTLPMLARALLVAAPAGLLIWLLANVSVEGNTLLQWLRSSLDGIGVLLCMDGAILLGFLLALPANEIALPAMLLIYTGAQQLQDSGPLTELAVLLRSRGWDGFTVAAVLIFTICHWPCATTLMTVKKETNSLKWTAVSFAVPALCGAALCAFFNLLVQLIT